MPELTASDEVALHYETLGDRESPAVVLLHSLCEDLRMWAPHVGPFSEDYQVVLPDLRGCGQSAAPEDPSAYSIERYVQDLVELLDALDIGLCAMAGSGFGGMVAAAFAVDHADRLAALVLSDTTVAPDHPECDERYREWERGIERAEEIVRRLGTAALGKKVASTLSDSFLAEGVRNRYARMSREGLLGAFNARRDRPQLLDAMAERLALPVLVTFGSEDPASSASEVMARRLPVARVVEFGGAGHDVPVQRPEAWGKAVLAFFADVEDGRPIAGHRTA